jgi:hypothetical protein
MHNSKEENDREKRVDYLIPSLLLMVTFIVFVPVLGVFFWQDDFVFLYEARFAKWTDILRAFLPWATGPLGFYRPLTTQLYFVIGDRIFGFKPEFYHAANLLLHTANAVLVYVLAKRLLKSRSVALCVALLYVTNRVHFESLCWISGIQEIGVTFFSLLAVVLYCSAPSNHSLVRRVLSGATYLLALMSKENAVIVPLLLLSFDMLNLLVETGPRKTRDIFVSQAILWGITGVYMASRLPYMLDLLTHSDGSYGFVLSTALFTKYGWGVLWSLDVLLHPLKRLKAALCPDSHLFHVFLLGAGLLLVANVLWFIYTVARRKSNGWAAISKARIALWGLLWFVLSMLPVVFVSNFAAYLFMLPVVGLLITMGWVLKQGWEVLRKKWGRYALHTALLASLCLYIVISGFSMVQTLMETEGLIKGAAGAQATVLALQSSCPQLEPGTVVTLVAFPFEVWWDDRAQAAFRVMYNQPSIQERHLRTKTDRSLVGNPILQWSEHNIVEVVSECK